LTNEVKKHAELYNVALTSRLEKELEQLEQKEAQLHQILQTSNIEPKLIE
jgi:hypothetical protein